MLARDAWMAHSMLSVPLNLGLLDPVEVAEAAESAPTAAVRHPCSPSMSSSAR
jgi:deoxyribodipyrimidine photolyase-like uncharacterized protein